MNPCGHHSASRKLDNPGDDARLPAYMARRIEDELLQELEGVRVELRLPRSRLEGLVDVFLRLRAGFCNVSMDGCLWCDTGVLCGFPSGETSLAWCARTMVFVSRADAQGFVCEYVYLLRVRSRVNPTGRRSTNACTAHQTISALASKKHDPLCETLQRERPEIAPPLSAKFDQELQKVI